jgi:NAD-dependent SIR2 family protein deacetylase
MAKEFYPPSVEPGCCGGIIKPNIIFFGEKLALNISHKLEEDYKKADALIVMGTSLSV